MTHLTEEELDEIYGCPVVLYETVERIMDDFAAARQGRRNAEVFSLNRLSGETFEAAHGCCEAEPGDRWDGLG